MLKRILLPLLFLPLVVACEKKAPPVPSAPPPATTAPVTPAPAPMPEAMAPTTMPAPTAPAKMAAAGNTAKGEDTYKKTCFACHDAGVAGAPKLRDKAAWGPRIAQGMDTLYTNSIKGFQGKVGLMPPKGGNAALSDADTKAAVDYMVSQSK